MYDKYSAKAHRYFEQSHINFKQKLILYFNATQSHPNILQMLICQQQEKLARFAHQLYNIIIFQV